VGVGLAFDFKNGLAMNLSTIPLIQGKKEQTRVLVSLESSLFLIVIDNIIILNPSLI
jgi:hypothetical protein